ncbi:hypothetical protein MRB53_035498 [Persea americana]|uniref:Uncharacterized protein n=1 Tax=Persea americana TaxID=3435 RepID=A0ACC2K4U9_PERAE|nr:hypothetical protein MRB53_035498 [Persea americana]
MVAFGALDEGGRDPTRFRRKSASDAYERVEGTGTRIPSPPHHLLRIEGRLQVIIQIVRRDQRRDIGGIPRKEHGCMDEWCSPKEGYS